jgi:hypothetical protein
LAITGRLVVSAQENLSLEGGIHSEEIRMRFFFASLILLSIFAVQATSPQAGRSRLSI